MELYYEIRNLKCDDLHGTSYQEIENINRKTDRRENHIQESNIEMLVKEANWLQ